MESSGLVLNLMALSALVPAAAIGLRKEPARDVVFWLFLAAAFIGPFLWVVTEFAAAWRTDLSAALWISIAATLAVYGFIAAMDREAWRLAPLLTPLMFIVGLLAFVWSGHPAARPLSPEQTTWIGIHIAVSVATYAVVTIVAVAGFAGILQERALKAKKPTAMTHALPSIAASDEMMMRLLAIAEAILAIGLISGMALNLKETGNVLSLDHKTVLAITAFAVIAALLVAHRLSGLRGRKAARWALSAYLILTLGYPGVKFVTDVMLS